MKELLCHIVSIKDYGNFINYEYAVLDGDEVVANGTSSNPDWVRHDAGGYHTKEKFDAKYPEGWKVNFSF